MTIVQIQMNKPNKSKGLAVFNLGFRPFFLGGSIFAVIAVFWWMLVYFSMVHIPIVNITSSQWHAHEMLYGYGLAVVAGFLLTAVKNWTGIATLHGKSLALLFGLWVSARVLFLFGTDMMLLASVADILFGLGLIAAIAMPIIKAKQWRQIAVVSKVMLLLLGNIVFYLGFFGQISNGMTYAIYGAALLFISLILMIGRRVIPFFIERGVGYKIELKQYGWLDKSILLLFLALFINAIFVHKTHLTLYLAIPIFLLNSFRLYNWHTHGIWRVSLLWGLFVSACLTNLGFLCYGLQEHFAIPSVLIFHIFTIGGIGLMSISMMARVSLGHTGRDIRNAPSLLSIAFACIALSVILRVFLPLFDATHYTWWVLGSSIVWIIGFAIFAVIYAPILLKQRVDGSFG